MTSTHWSHQHFDLWSFLLDLTAHSLLQAVEWSKQKLVGPGLQVYRLATPMKTHENIVSEHKTMSRETRPSFFPLPPPPKTSYQSYRHTPPDEIWPDSSFTRNRSLTVHTVLTNQVEYQFLSELLPSTHAKSATSANPKWCLSAELLRIHETTPSPPKNVHGYRAHTAQVKFSTVPAKKIEDVSIDNEYEFSYEIRDFAYCASFLRISTLSSRPVKLHYDEFSPKTRSG